jgi:hypothetical protein
MPDPVLNFPAVLAQLPPTGVDPEGVQTTGGETAGLIVLLVVVVVIVGGATILWLRHRRPRS